MSLWVLAFSIFKAVIVFPAANSERLYSRVIKLPVSLMAGKVVLLPSENESENTTRLS
jgi:hypothetical protein